MNTFGCATTKYQLSPLWIRISVRRPLVYLHQCFLAANTVLRQDMVDVDNITEIEWKDNVFEKLVLPSSHKELVRVLVENHTSKHQFDDFVEGKGKGLVAVLHGPPGELHNTGYTSLLTSYRRRQNHDSRGSGRPYPATTVHCHIWRTGQ